MKRIALLFFGSLIALPALACTITVINDLGTGEPIIVVDGVEGDVDRLPIMDPNIAGHTTPEQVYRSSKFATVQISPNNKATIGQPHTHAHFLMGIIKPGGVIKWHELTQWQCTGRTHETLNAKWIRDNKFGNLNKHFGSKRLP